MIDEFLDYCRITAGESTIRKIENAIIQIADALQKPLDELNLKDVRAFLSLLNRSNKAAETKNDIKKTLRRFLRWLYKDWSDRFDAFKDIKTTNGVNEKRVNASTILSPLPYTTPQGPADANISSSQLLL